jgi:Arrestin (or S-antigen), C-terminal domain
MFIALFSVFSHSLTIDEKLQILKFCPWFLADRPDEKPHRRCTVRMGIRVLQRCPVAVGLRGADSPPRANIEKSFMLSDGRVRLEAVLDRAHYRQGEPVHVKLSIHNHSRKTVRRIKVKI